MVSVTSNGSTIGSNTSQSVKLSADNSFVAFLSNAPNLGATDGIFYQVIKKSLTNLASAPLVLSTGKDGVTISNNDCSYPEISADGNEVLFWSYATNFGFAKGSGSPQWYIKVTP